ncbi:spore germination protein [Paenibacillus dendritiformis]|uniref:spore germination protein n=1 Tax=Paenibacillus dendritiformis TaxID=130049 RepID=UPI001B26C1CE|nr:spore germination protein [Paenibacillus dendritiformis]GIO76176.1 spore germination protein [Paenibacillus dendritiformis]
MSAQYGKVNERMSDNVQQLQSIFSQAPDLIYRSVDTPNGPEAMLVYFDGLVDLNSINNHVLYPLIEGLSSTEYSLPVTVGHVESTSDMSQVEKMLLNGKSVLFLPGSSEAYIFDTCGWPQRSITDPSIEASVKGSHQGFVETATQNIALIRRYIPNRELKIKQLKVGKRGENTLSIMYLQDVADPEVMQELTSRIEGLDIDNVINTGELSELIEDSPYSPFPQLLMTERPDSAASHILQGRYVVVVDRSPSVLIGPVTFVSFFQSVDDYSIRWMNASFIRLLRFFAFFLALFLPSLYISFITFNFEVIPIQLILSVAESRERVPFHPFLEAFIMEVTLEMMREAGIRLPAPIGQTVGLVGGIIIGQTAVQAGIVSNIMVIVVASTAIASFIIPNIDMGTAIRFLRFPMMLVAFMYGFIGIVCGAMILLSHLCSLTSLGTAYGSPLAPVRYADLKDTFLRFPLWAMKTRPTGPGPKQLKRQGENSPEGGNPK